VNLLPICKATEVSLVYDVYHYRCKPDELTIEQATKQRLANWDREPMFHMSARLKAGMAQSWSITRISSTCMISLSAGGERRSPLKPKPRPKQSTMPLCGTPDHEKWTWFLCGSRVSWHMRRDWEGGRATLVSSNPQSSLARISLRTRDCRL
jgi:hypothetical protein